MGQNDKLGGKYMRKIKVIDIKYNKKNIFFSFNFTFDDFESDNCIVYNKIKPDNFACNNIYSLKGYKYKEIKRAIKSIINYNNLFGGKGNFRT